MRHFLLRLFQLICVLVIAALLWGGWYLSQRGFTKKWRTYVTRELQNRGFDISMSRLTLDPFRGLVARTVRIEDSTPQHHLLATLDELVLDINVANLLQKRPFIEAVELRDADVSLPIGPDNDLHQTLQISRFNARVLLPPHQIYISRATARIFGINCTLAGRLVNPESLTTASTANPTKTSNGTDLLATIQQTMNEVTWRGHTPRLDLHFTGDGTLPKEMSVDLGFHTDGVAWRGCTWRELSFQASYGRQSLELKQLTARDEVGRLDMAGSVDTLSGQVDGQAHSSLDVAKIAAALGFSASLKDCKFTGPPVVDVSARGNYQTSGYRLLGQIEVPQFEIRKVGFHEISGQFSWDGKRWYFRDVLLRNDSGQLSLNAMSVPGNFRAQLQSTINPNTLQPLLSGPAATALREWNFLQSPEIRLNAQGSAPSVGVCTLEGSLKLGRTRYRGAGLNSLTTDVHADHGDVTFDNLHLTRDEGTATGSLTYNFARQEVQVKDLKTSLFPAETIVWVDPRMVPNVTPYRLKVPPALTINGHVQTFQDTYNHLEVLVSAPQGLDYTFVGKDLSLKKVSGRLLFTHGNLNLSNVSGDLFDGQLMGNADVSIDPQKPTYRAHVETHGMDFSTLTKLYFNYDTSQGQLDGFYDFSGKPDDLRSMTGTGSLKVTNGNVFSIPVFGPLSGLTNGIIPGFGYNVAHEATATFSVASGIITTNDFLVHGKGFNMLGYGKLDFVENKLDFNIRISGQGLTGALWNPLGRLFEYEGQGKLSNPTWKPKRLPSL